MLRLGSRAESDGKSIMLWAVSGLKGISGVVSSYDQNDRHVRESIEYVEADQKLIEDLKLEGFFQLHQIKLIQRKSILRR